MRRVPASVGRVLQAVELTLADVEDQAATQALLSFDSGDSSTIRGGGLRSGHFRAGNTGLSMTRIVFVPGVTVSGRLLNRAGRIGQITCRRLARDPRHGHLRRTRHRARADRRAQLPRAAQPGRHDAARDRAWREVAATTGVAAPEAPLGA